METTKRFENAVSKLYNSFHENRLEGEICTACAVGNICDGRGDWFAFRLLKNNGKQSYYNMEIANEIVSKSGYTSKELLKVEDLFLKAVEKRENKETQFQGLCAVVEYLAELDNIPNPMDYSKLFETENESAKYSLVEVFN